MDRQSISHFDRDQEHEQGWEDDPSPLELEALRQFILQKNEANTGNNDAVPSAAREQSPSQEQKQPQRSDAEGKAPLDTMTTDERQKASSTPSSSIEEIHRMDYEDINPLEMEALRQQVLMTHDDSYGKAVLEAARLVDRNLGGGSRPAPGTTSCRGIQSTLNANQQSALASGKGSSIITSKTPSRRRPSSKHKSIPAPKKSPTEPWWSSRSVCRRRWRQDYIVPRIKKKAAIKPLQQLPGKDLDDRIRLTFEIANYLQKQALIRKLAIALMRYGSPSHRLMQLMRQTTHAIDIDTAFVYMPNVMLISFLDKDAHTTETYFMGEMQGFDMHRLNEVYRLNRLIMLGQTTIDQAISYLVKVMDAPGYFPEWVRSLSYAFAGFASALIFFNGGWPEAGLAAALGFFLAFYEILSNHWAGLGPLFDISVCIIIGFIATAASHSNICYTPAAFGAVVVLLPGWPMASAIMELTSRNVISGIIRLVYALIYSYLMAFGLTTGQAFYLTFDQTVVFYNPDTCPSQVSKWWFFLFVPWFCTCFCIFVRALPRRWPLMILVACAGFAVSFALSNYTKATTQVTQIVPAFCVGFLGNLYSKVMQDMSFDAILLGAFLLVPGAVGLRSGLEAFSGVESTKDTGAGFALSMIQASIGITVGLYLSTLLFYPRGTHHTPLASF